MAGKDVAVVVKTTQPKGVARRLWRVVRAVLYMMRRGLPSGRKLSMDLHLLLHRGKIAGKALRALVNFHHHDHAAAAGSSSFSLRGRREIEFSCSSSPSNSNTAGGGALERRRSNLHDLDDESTAGYHSNYDAADIAGLLEMLNDSGHLFDDDALAVAPSPAPRTSSAYGRSRPATRQLRITDSPYPARNDDDAGEQQVDKKADEFIRRFYEQLRGQKSVASTPDNYGYAASPYSGHSARPVAAGFA